MVQMNLENRNKREAVRGFRRIFSISIPATMVASATLAIVFALALDGCSKHQNKENTSVAYSQPSQGEIAPAPVLPSPTPAPTNEAKTEKKAKVRRPSTVAFKDDGYGVSFRYPRKYKLLTPEKGKESSEELAAMPMNFVQPGGVNVAGVELTRGEAVPFLNVNVNKGLTADQCQTFAVPEQSAGDQTPIDTDDESGVKKVSLRGTEFSKVETVTDQLEARYYHHFEPGADKDSGLCYEVVLGVVQPQDNSKQVDSTAMFTQLERILGTMKIKPEIASTETASVPSQPVTTEKPQ
ncbi:MAG TPA: hypothetical protein VJN64_11065 [Terriglobales bacterium]|nr:hypothetical protein [Terriglobales bacterium]